MLKGTTLSVDGTSSLKGSVTVTTGGIVAAGQTISAQTFSGALSGNAASATVANGLQGTPNIAVGTVTASGTVTAPTFTGSLSGNASSATVANGLQGTPNIAVGTISSGAITSSGAVTSANHLPPSASTGNVGTAALPFALVTATNVNATTFSGALSGNASSATVANGLQGTPNIAVGTVTASGTVTAPTFSGALSGNASSATTSASCSGNAASATVANGLQGTPNIAVGTLSATGDMSVNGRVTIGTSGSAQNGLYFAGTTSDATHHSVILNRLYDSGGGAGQTVDYSEILLFQGNDSGHPDRIRSVAGAHQWQIYQGGVGPTDTATFWGENNYVTAMYIAPASGNVGINTKSPAHTLDVNGTLRSTGNVTAPTFSGNLSGNASSATTSASCSGNAASASVANGLQGTPNIAVGTITASGTVTAPTFSGNLNGNASSATTSASCSGNAASASVAYSLASSPNITVVNLNTTNLYASGSGTINGNLSIGTSGSGQNGLYFAQGTAGDVGPAYSCILSRNYDPSGGASPVTDYSEILLFQANDATSSGPDRIRNVAAAHKWQIYTSAVSPTDSASFWADNNFTTAMYIAPSTGYVGIATASPAYTLDVNGNIHSRGAITATGDITGLSDRRVKDNIQRIADPLDKIDRINGYTFTRNDDSCSGKPDVRRHAGVVAQEVLEVLPEVIRETPEGMLSVAYGNIVALLIEGIKELRKDNVMLRDAFDELRKDNVELRKTMNHLVFTVSSRLSE